LLSGLALLTVGLILAAGAVFGVPEAGNEMRLMIPSGTCILLAFQTAYGAFFLSVLEIRSGRETNVQSMTGSG
jgi:hypothetical protein